MVVVGVGAGMWVWGSGAVVQDHDIERYIESRSFNIEKILDEESLATSKENTCFTTARYHRHW